MSRGTPVGNMIIKVDLDAVGVEKSMTGLQRQLKTSNKSMRAQLSAFDRSEKSASKFGVVIEGLSNRHRIQGQMVEEARARYNHMTETYGENSVKAQQAAQELNEQIARYQEVERELKSVQAEFEEFQRVQEIQNKGWYKAADSMEEWGGKLKASGRQMDETGKTLTRKVTLPLTAVGGIATKVGSDFEAGMSRVGAISGASAEDMEKLEAKAREMGATTVFSASEASDAFYYMSLAGWSAQESMDGISGVMDLAAASGEDLALVADIVTDGLTAFGLQAKDSGRMADVLASASANANTDVSGLGQAFQYVAPVAGALGYSIEDTSKAIGLMANAGIKSTKAGTALRTMMTNLTKPTDAQAAAMKRYGISLTDSKGEMKTFDRVMLDLRKSLGGLDKDQQAAAASTIFGKEAMSGALAIINTSESDYKKLTKAIKESDGAAGEMADTMQDNLQGSLKELKSMVEDLFIEMYKNLKPAFESLIENAKDLTKWFSDLSPSTQENIVKFGLLAAAMGPVLSVTGKLTMGVGSLMEGTGRLVKTIGLSEGAGLLGALSSLGPGAVAGVAVAGIGAVAYGVHKFKQKADKAKEVNLDLAESFTDQALELEGSVEAFDRLSEKAKISNEELAELNDLNIKISESSNPGEIQQLQEQYNKLAEKSGLSKDELKELFEANTNIIEQSPEVQQSISDEGNAFVESTDAVKEYINSLYEMSKQELDLERVKHLEEEGRLRKELAKEQEKLNRLQEETNVLVGIQSMTEDQIYDRQEEISALFYDTTISQEEKNKLQNEFAYLQSALNDELGEEFQSHQESLKTQQEKVATIEEELEKGEVFNTQYQDILLKQIGINEEGEKGLAKLEETISKNQEEIDQLEAKRRSSKGLTDEEHERYLQLIETNEKQKEAKDYLYEELGTYKDINSLANAKLDKLDHEGKKRVENLLKTQDLKDGEQDIVKELDKKLGKLTKERDQLEENRQKQGANKQEIDKQISAVDDKISKQARAKKELLEELGIWNEVDQKTRDNINNEIRRGDAARTTATRLDAQGRSIDDNNRKTDIGIDKERERSKEAGRDATKNVNARDNNTISDIDRRASRPVSKTINFIGKGLGKLKFWAKGTPPSGHPGGLAVVGDGGGRELVSLPGGKSFLSPATDTLLNLPKGTHVMPHRPTERLMRGIPRYAQGTRNWLDSARDSELMRLLALNSESRGRGNRRSGSGIDKLLDATIQQNQILIELLKSQDKTTKAIENDEDGTISERMIRNTLLTMMSRGLNKNMNEDNLARGGSY